MKPIYALFILVAMTQGLLAETISGPQIARQLEAEGMDSRHARIVADHRSGVMSCLASHTQCMIGSAGAEGREGKALGSIRCSMDLQICLMETEDTATSALRGWTM